MGTDRSNGSLYTKIENRVATVEFGHPAGNSFVRGLLDRLANEFDLLSGNKEVSLIVLKSEGDRAFCAGASFNELINISDLAGGKLFFGGFAKVINAMRKCSKPIIGRIQGKAVGGGVGLIAACDYVMASVQASVRLSELTIGIAPLVIAPAVERKIGKAGLAELALAPAEWKNAYWAKEKGLFAEVFDDIPTLDKELYFHCKKLAAYNPEGLANMKQVLWEGTGHWDELLEVRAEMSGKLVLSEETKKALSQYKKE